MLRFIAHTDRISMQVHRSFETLRSAQKPGGLLLITSVMRQLIGDENFITLLRAEAIVDMPKQLRARLD
jgi:hypothetical protein